MPLTLAQIQTPLFSQAAGNCTTSSPDFLDMVNEVVPRLMERGDWPGSILPIRVCVKAGCVTWPRYVGQVRKINHCRGNIAVKSVWYEFLEHDHSRSRGMYSWQGWCGDERRMTAQLKVPVYNDIYGPNCTVQVYCQVPEDIGATVTIFGIDNNGQPLRTDNGDGTWSDGITITVAIPFGSTGNPYFVSRIDRVVKSRTQGNLTMFAYDTANNVLWDLAVYEPSETNPSYLRYHLDGRWNAGNPASCGGCLETIIALVKLKFIPVSSPTDLIPIESRAAIKLGLLALRREMAEDIAGADQWWARAIETLNRNLENENPDSELPVQNNVFGDRTFRNQCF